MRLTRDSSVLLQHVAKARGKLRPGGTADTVAAARVVLTDWNDGRIRFYTEPPQRDGGGHDGAAIVKDWAAAFDADQVRHCARSKFLTCVCSKANLITERLAYEAFGRACVKHDRSFSARK